MIVFAAKLTFDIFFVLICCGLVVGIVSAITAEVKFRLNERRLANRWKENANPFIGAP
jgi:hypothetical protein